MIDNINRRRASAYSWHQLGTRCTVMGTGPGDIRLAAALVQGELALLDRTCSRFRSDTELAEVTWGRWSEVSALLFSLISAAIRSAELSDGAVDPTVDLARLGYDRDLSLVQLRYSPAEDRRAGPLVLTPGWRGIGLNASSSQVFLPEGSTSISIQCQGVGRGPGRHHLCRGLRRRFPGQPRRRHRHCRAGSGRWLAGDDRGVGGHLRGGPGLGCRPGGQPAPRRSGHLLHRLPDLATGGRLRHHIIDPSTGEPAEPVWRTVSVAAASAELANTASTAAVVFGEQAPLWLTERGIAARLAPTWAGSLHLRLARRPRARRPAGRQPGAVVIR